MTAICLCAMTFIIPSEARATSVACGPGLTPAAGIPLSTALHVGSLLPVNIGLAASKGGPGWRVATYVAVPFNLAGGAALLTADALLGDDCRSKPSVEGIHPATWVTEAMATVWSVSLLTAALVLESDSVTMVSAQVAPTADGAIAVVGFSF